MKLEYFYICLYVWWPLNFALFFLVFFFWDYNQKKVWYLTKLSRNCFTQFSMWHHLGIFDTAKIQKVWNYYHKQNWARICFTRFSMWHQLGIFDTSKKIKSMKLPLTKLIRNCFTQFSMWHQLGFFNFFKIVSDEVRILWHLFAYLMTS